MLFATLGAAGGWATLFAAGLYNWVAQVYGYNRDGWMTDVQLKQQYEYQRDNMAISTHAMSREEVRDRTQAAITKLSNYILVTTLILSLSAEIMVEGRVPALSVDFILNVYMLCLGTSVLYLVLSILFGIVAINQIYEVSASILTERIPAAWKTIDGGMRERAKKNLVRDFERKPWRQIFTPPLLKRFSARTREDRENEVKADPDEDDDRRDSEYYSNDCETGPAPSITDEGYLQGIRNMYSNAFQEKEKVWEPLTSQSFECLALGVKNLLDVYGYLCMARLYSEYGSAWAFWAVMCIFTCLNVLLMLFLFQTANPLRNTIVVASGPMLCCIAATTPYVIVDCWCVPACYLSHFLLLILFSTPVDRRLACSLQECGTGGDDDALRDLLKSPFGTEENGYTQIPLVASRCEFESRENTNVDAEEIEFEYPEGEKSEPLKDPLKDLTRKIEYKSSVKPRNMVAVVARMVCIARNVLRTLWFISFLWAVLKAFSRHGFKNSKALLHLSGPRLAHSELLETRWPSPYFSPHALVCPRKNEAFLADQFRVFQLDINHSVTPYPCDVNGTIADISADCDDERCWPMVLLNRMPPAVLECSTGKEYPLLQTDKPAEQFAVVNSFTLLAAHHGEIVQYAWCQRRKGWAPNWVIGDIGAEELQALDVTDDAERVLVFRRQGVVQLQDLKTGKQCGIWETPPAILGAGCGEESGKTLKLLIRINDPVLGPQVRLMRTSLDGPQNCDQVNPDTVTPFSAHPNAHPKLRHSGSLERSVNNRWFN